MLDPPAQERGEEHDGERDPDDCDHQVDEPLRLRVLFALRDAERHRRHRQQHRELPAPEREARQAAECQPHMTGALDHVVTSAHQRRAAEREDHAEGVIGADAAVGQPGDVEVERRPGELRRREHAREHARNAPDRRRHQEQADNVIVVGFSRLGRGSGSRAHSATIASIRSGAIEEQYAPNTYRTGGDQSRSCSLRTAARRRCSRSVCPTYLYATAADCVRYRCGSSREESGRIAFTRSATA